MYVFTSVYIFYERFLAALGVVHPPPSGLCRDYLAIATSITPAE